MPDATAVPPTCGRHRRRLRERVCRPRREIRRPHGSDEKLTADYHRALLARYEQPAAEYTVFFDLEICLDTTPSIRQNAASGSIQCRRLLVTARLVRTYLARVRCPRSLAPGCYFLSKAVQLSTTVIGME